MDTDWPTRLGRAIKADGRSMRAISLESGLGANYLSEIFRDGKEPGVEKMMKICATLNVSFTYVITGANLGPDDEDFFRILSELPPKERQTLVDLARALKKGQRP